MRAEPGGPEASGQGHLPCRNLWYGSARELALALEKAPGVRRLHVFDLAPRLMRGLYSACFAAADGSVHRFLAPYYDVGRLRRELAGLRDAVRRLGLPVVDGRIEIGAVTGERLHYFLPNVDEARGEKERERCRLSSHRMWLGAVAGAGKDAAVLRLADEGGETTVACATVCGEHYLIRLGNQPRRSVSDVRRRLPRLAMTDLEPGTALWQDVMGDWRP